MRIETPLQYQTYWQDTTVQLLGGYSRFLQEYETLKETEQCYPKHFTDLVFWLHWESQLF